MDNYTQEDIEEAFKADLEVVGNYFDQKWNLKLLIFRGWWEEWERVHYGWMFPGLPNTQDEAERQEKESSMEGGNGQNRSVNKVFIN